jgi:hypothetical protein
LFTGGEDGCGTGLAACTEATVRVEVLKKATQLLNGTISVESEPGKDTRFVVRVPLIYGA